MRSSWNATRFITRAKNFAVSPPSRENFHGSAYRVIARQRRHGSRYRELGVLAEQRLDAGVAGGNGFHRATKRVAQRKPERLMQCVRDNIDTAFGRRFEFSRIDNPKDFQERVPLATYENYSDAVGRIAAGESNVLTREPVILLEPTSGTTSGEKLIPYTASLRAQFQQGIAPWIANLLHQRPGLRNGRAYWSISPALGPRRMTAGGIPIGFDDDTAYLGLVERFAASRLLATPPTLARISDLDAFRYATLLHLLRAEDLTLISIWNPTFLTALLRPLGEWFDRLCHDIRHGSHDLPPDAPRADALMNIQRRERNEADRLSAIWPRLQLISCWTDAAAATFVPEVRRLFPNVEIQPKGLIATEAFVSLPLIDHDGAALAIRSHFFEFQESGDHGACRLAHEVARGGRYRVVVTTAGGLYRYQLRDEVEIVGFLEECPLLRFLGKADLVGDLVGEKLSEPFVRAALEGLWSAKACRPSFFLMAPMPGNPPHYCLFVQSSADATNWQAELQTALEANPHYRYACGLGQLGPVEIRVLPVVMNAQRRYEDALVSRGQKLGNIKPTTLDVRFGWERVFEKTPD